MVQVAIRIGILNNFDQVVNQRGDNILQSSDHINFVDAKILLILIIIIVELCMI